MKDSLPSVLTDIRACRICRDLPLGPGPVLRASSEARLLVCGQAPGTKAHETNTPWNDRSGDVLRNWLGLDRHVFYDERLVAIVPMGFCYPGRDAKGGDRPPRKACAEHWHGRLLPLLSGVRTVLLVGGHAQKYHLGDACRPTLTETVRRWRAYGPRRWPLPHPSWRNTGWLRRNPWFEEELLPALRRHLGEVLA